MLNNESEARYDLSAESFEELLDMVAYLEIDGDFDGAFASWDEAAQYLITEETSLFVGDFFSDYIIEINRYNMEDWMERNDYTILEGEENAYLINSGR